MAAVTTTPQDLTCGHFRLLKMGTLLTWHYKRGGKGLVAVLNWGGLLWGNRGQAPIPNQNPEVCCTRSPSPSSI